MPRKSSTPAQDTKSKNRPASRGSQMAESAKAVPASAETALAEAGLAETALAEAVAMAVSEAADASVPDHAPAVLIELDEHLDGGIVGDRFDIAIRGRAVSAAPIEEVRLQAEGRVFSAAAFGNPGQAAEAEMPDGAAARQRGFLFNLPRPGLDASGSCRFQIVARTAGGEEHAEDFTVDFDAASGHAAFMSGPAIPGVASTPARPHAIVYVEQATLDPDGLLSVSGWALAMGPILVLQVYADEARVGNARQGDERADVTAAHPSFPNGRRSGFSFARTLDAPDLAADFVRVQAVCHNGFAQEIVVPIQRTVRRGQPGGRAAEPPR
ncbi:MAG TPA: hypothetical protein VFG62_14870, partial [Rhodopila sp.]|nr:hypothetical protein [Rhodopila sp.]